MRICLSSRAGRAGQRHSLLHSLFLHWRWLYTLPCFVFTQFWFHFFFFFDTPAYCFLSGWCIDLLSIAYDTIEFII